MNAQKLKNTILQYAVEGKLVEQTPNEESVKEILQKIQKEKERLIKEKIIKRDSLLSPSSNTEQPFEIPKTWKWVRLGEIFEITSSKRVHQKDWESKGVPFYRAREIVSLKKKEPLKDPLFISEELYARNREISGVPKIGDILVTGVGTIGITYLVEEDKPFYFKDGNIIWLKNHFNLYANFITLLFEAPLIKKLIFDDAQGTTVNTFTIIRAKNLLIPIPPIEEQKRIVYKFNMLEKQIETYGKLYDQQESLRINFPVDLEKSILQSAMQGKLVNQSAANEVASVLVEEIKQKKEELVKHNIIKKEKTLAQIAKEEIPFEIPITWKWVRLGEITQLISGRDLTTSEYNASNQGIPYITGASNFQKGELDIVRWTDNPKVITKEGDLLITCKGTIGEMAIQNLPEAHIARQVMALRMIKSTSKEYIQLCLRFLINELKNSAKSMIPGISREDILNLKIPLPPFEEQHKIVAKVEELSVIIQKLSKKNPEVVQENYSLVE